MSRNYLSILNSKINLKLKIKKKNGRKGKGRKEKTEKRELSTLLFKLLSNNFENNFGYITKRR